MTQTLTTDELRQIVDSHEKGYGMSVPINYGYLAAAELLANREAQPVVYIGAQMLEDLTDGARGCGRVWASSKDVLSGDDRLALYTAPPAPVVPEETDLDSARMAVGFNRYIQAGYVDGWNACRAAMLAVAPEGGN